MFEYFETMADIGVIAKGKTLEEAFEESAKALFNIMVDISQIKKRIKIEFEVSSEDLYSLLYDFLTELLIMVDCENIILSEFDVKISRKIHENNNDNNDNNNNNNKNEDYDNNDNNRSNAKNNNAKNNEFKEYYVLKCRAYGEILDKSKHDTKEEVKAITYHKMEIKKEENEYVIKYIVDL